MMPSISERLTKAEVTVKAMALDREDNFTETLVKGRTVRRVPELPEEQVEGDVSRYLRQERRRRSRADKHDKRSPIPLSADDAREVQRYIEMTEGRSA
jgi:hypothetical protein